VCLRNYYGANISKQHMRARPFFLQATHLTIKSKGIWHIYSATSHILQLQQCFCVTNRAGVHSIGHSPRPRPRTSTFNLTATCSPGPLFDGLHPRNPCNYTNYYSVTNPRGMEGWVGLVGWPIVDSLPYPQSGHLSTTEQAYTTEAEIYITLRCLQFSHETSDCQLSPTNRRQKDSVDNTKLHRCVMQTTSAVKAAAWDS